MFEPGHAGLSEFLARHGFIAADDEARELLEAADGAPARLRQMVTRRLTGEPLAWITGISLFFDMRLAITPGTYVPRPHTEVVAQQAAQLLPPLGRAIDLCTGSGAIAAYLMDRHPGATIIGTDIQEASVQCARQNGINAVAGDLFDSVPPVFLGQTDLVTAVVPYVPHETLHSLQRDTFTFETTQAYDGGLEGLNLLRRTVRQAPEYLKPGGHLVLELGPNQPEKLALDLAQNHFGPATKLFDEDGDLRGIWVRFEGP